ncbi:hypothetical protein NL676_005579 [Syzygium grande]|nr:hypothetical protein NL676_005579 [Syzygium grande]
MEETGRERQPRPDSSEDSPQERLGEARKKKKKKMKMKMKETGIDPSPGPLLLLLHSLLAAAAPSSAPLSNRQFSSLSPLPGRRSAMWILALVTRLTSPDRATLGWLWARDHVEAVLLWICPRPCGAVGGVASSTSRSRAVKWVS